MLRLASTFKYRAVDNRGNIYEGTYIAESKNEVISMIRQGQGLPIKIEEVEPQTLSVNELNIFKPRVKTKELAIFCKQFYTMINAGVDLTNSLEVLIDQTENKTLKHTLTDVFLQVQKGSLLSEAMKKHPNVFPAIFISMVESGEMTGSLDEVLDRMYEHFDKENKINSKIKNAMIYPIILTFLSIAVVIFLLIFIMPTFISMFSAAGTDLPLATRLLLIFSELLIEYWYIFTIGFIAIILMLNKVSNTYKGKKFFDQLKLKIPFINTSIVKIITSRFTRTLASLLNSGIPIISALETSANVTNNIVVIEGIQMVLSDIRKGVSLATLLNRMDIFPPMVISMVSIGEETGALDEMLAKTADFYDDELEVAIERMVSMLEPFMIVVMSIIIGFIVIAMLLPMFDIMQVI